MNYPRRAALMAAAIIVVTAVAVVSSSQTQLQFLGMATVFGSKAGKSGHRIGAVKLIATARRRLR